MQTLPPISQESASSGDLVHTLSTVEEGCNEC
jgi:hypothetical protein